MIFKLACKNIVGSGWRSLINVLILAAVLIGLVWAEGMWFSWLTLAKTQQKEWEYAAGILRARNFDPLDTFSWEKGYSAIPDNVKEHIETGSLIPLLYSPAVIYPQGRMHNAVVKGIPADQQLLRIPSQALANKEEFAVPAIIGKAMARSTQLQPGDAFTLRLKNSEDAYDALELQIVKIMSCPVPSLDIGTVWIDYDALRRAKLLPEVATVMVMRSTGLAELETEGFRYIDEQEFFADLNQMVQTKAAGQMMPFSMLIFLAMLAIFDTQALAIFKRRKEIGMLSALGMTKRQIIALFTTEGVLYMLFAALAAIPLGFPFFYFFSAHGLALPMGYDSFGIVGFDEPLKFHYSVPLIMLTLLFLIGLTAVVSWLPARKIARMNPTEALRGK